MREGENGQLFDSSASSVRIVCGYSFLDEVLYEVAVILLNESELVLCMAVGSVSLYRERQRCCSSIAT